MQSGHRRPAPAPPLSRPTSRSFFHFRLQSLARNGVDVHAIEFACCATHARSPNYPQLLLHARHRNPQIGMADAPEKWEEVKGARRHGAVKRKKVHTANNHRFIAR
jgi:hypothetical protein